MERIITIKDRVGRYDIPSFTFADNETLTLKFDIQEKRVGLYIALVTCGEQKKTFYLNKEMSIDIHPDFIKKGEYKAICVFLELRNMQGNKVIISNKQNKGGFFIEPLYIEKVEGDNNAIAWCKLIEKHLEENDKRLKEAEAKLEEFEDNGVPLLVED